MVLSGDSEWGEGCAVWVEAGDNSDDSRARSPLLSGV